MWIVVDFFVIFFFSFKKLQSALPPKFPWLPKTETEYKVIYKSILHF